jgi:hypothetical protein
MAGVVRLLVLLLLSTWLPACASDAAPEPEPRLEQPGAFVAVDDGEAELTLFRTLSTLYADGDTILFVTLYDVEPSTWEEAREVSKGHDIPVRELVTFASKNLVIKNPYRVVWFRTLTQEEEELVQ